MSTTMTLRIPDHVKDKLEILATATHRSKSFLAAEALDLYIKQNEWQINAIQQGINDVEQGKIISHKKIVKKWEKKLGDHLDRKRKS